MFGSKEPRKLTVLLRDPQTPIESGKVQSTDYVVRYEFFSDSRNTNPSSIDGNLGVPEI